MKPVAKHGIMGVYDDGGYFGKCNEYPTAADFFTAVAAEQEPEGYTVADVSTIWIAHRLNQHPDGADHWWEFVQAGARGATKAWCVGLDGPAS